MKKRPDGGGLSAAVKSCGLVIAFGAVIAYVFLLCHMLKMEVLLLFSVRHMGMFLLGCIILSIPHLERGMKWPAVRETLRRNVITAGYLEAFMLLFSSMNQGVMMQQSAPWRELILDLRPLFYGFVCYAALKGEEEPERDRSEEKSEKGGPEEKAPAEAELLEEAVPSGQEKAPVDLSGLTRQEKLVVELIRRGLTNREIGEELCISEGTVKKHVSNIFEKLGIRSRKELR